jgi:hypothetical protein
VSDTIKAICRLVEEKLRKYIAPSKIIVYRGSIKWTVEIREAIRCLIYHYSIDNRAGKARRIKELIKGKH